LIFLKWAKPEGKTGWKGFAFRHRKTNKTNLPIKMAPPILPMTPPIMAELLLLGCVVVLPVDKAGSVGEMVTIAVDTTMVTSVPVPIWDVNEVTFSEVIGVALEVVVTTGEGVVCGVSELFSCQDVIVASI
jgi:hypothetical protein